MFDNLRRSLVAPMSLALLLLALAGGRLSPWAALALVLAAFATGPLIGAVAGFAPSRDDIALRHFYRQARADLARALWRRLWQLAQLLQQALPASMRSCARCTARPSAAATCCSGPPPPPRRRRPAPTCAPSRCASIWRDAASRCVLLAALLRRGTPHPVLAIAAVPAVGRRAAVDLVGQPAAAGRQRRRAAGRPIATYLHGIARDTWRFFERCVGADDHHLPPDNLQTAPHDMVAHRTSPTNIGLYLLAWPARGSSAGSAPQELLARWRPRWPRWRGCSATAATSSTGTTRRRSRRCCRCTCPRSTAATCAATCWRWPARAPNFARRKALTPWNAPPARPGATAHRLRWRPTSASSTTRQRHLFHIGYRVAEQQLDAGFYDLLASESRLTSLLAIAKGDVPVSHWAALGRPFYAVGSRRPGCARGRARCSST